MTYSANACFRFAIVLCVIGSLTSGSTMAVHAADTDDKAGKSKERRPQPLQVLQAARQPMLGNAWGRFEGRLVRKDAEGKLTRYKLRLALRLKNKKVKAKLMLEEKGGYLIEFDYAEPGKGPEVEKTGTAEPPATFEELGIRAEELFLSFLYWDLDRVIGRGVTVRGLSCSVLRLRHPETREFVKLWLSEKYAFPVKSAWYKQNGKKPSRQFQVTELKQHGDTWFLKTAVLSGAFGRVKLVLNRGNLRETSVRKVPDDLFTDLRPDQPGTHRPPEHRR